MQHDPLAGQKRLIREAASIAGLSVVELTDAREWPQEMASDAFIGLAGDFVRLIEPHTEADPVALLGNFLVGTGVLFGREAYAVADGRKHYPVESLLVVGQTGSGRKGTATGRVMPILEAVEQDFSSRVLSGLSSGEGLIKGISPAEGAIELPGDVRRFLALLPEFASLLTVMKREGNTLSAILREAWDCNRLRVLTRKEPLDVDDVNLSVIAHVTPEELLNNLTATERCNGFANRFLITLVRRSKILPEGGGDVNLSPIVARLTAAVEAAKERGQVSRDSAARALWASEYERLTRQRDGIRGALCGRAEAHVLRLSLLYALLDSANAIRQEHLQAALAFWEYCERSIEHLFGSATGDVDGHKILNALSDGPMTMTDLYRLFANHRNREWIEAKMGMLVRSKRVMETVKVGDRKESVSAWVLKGKVQE